MGEEEKNLTKEVPMLAVIGPLLALLSAAVALASAAGSRWGLWHFSTGFKILGGAAIAGAMSSVLSLIGLIAGFRKRLWGYFLLSCIGFALGMNVFGVPYSWYRAAKTLPLIHDITTDIGNPPRFVAVLPLRANAPNPAEYGGPEVAAKQHQAYHDIQPLVLDVPAEKAFDKALAVARKMSWDIVAADKEAMQIEATDTTALYGFKDDIVVRITPLGAISRVDVRSVSRVGLSDVGTNATRIRKFFRNLSK